jgi:hypothetical protein
MVREKSNQCAVLSASSRLFGHKSIVDRTMRSINELQGPPSRWVFGPQGVTFRLQLFCGFTLSFRTPPGAWAHRNAPCVRTGRILSLLFQREFGAGRVGIAERRAAGGGPKQISALREGGQHCSSIAASVWRNGGVAE